jgi:hypothetical protein
MDEMKIPDDGARPDNGHLPADPVQNGERKLIDAHQSLYQKIVINEKVSEVLYKIINWLLVLVVIASLLAVFMYGVPALQEIPLTKKTTITNSEELRKDALYKKQIILIKRDIQRLSRRYNSYTSGQSYLVINTTDNLFYLYSNKKLVRQGHCSTGSFKMLKTEEGRSWVFKTPKGKFWIHGKTENPSWRRPDWSFVEEGLPIPPQNHYSRWEYGVLGDYALSIGDGYLIHGTIYKRFLGMPVTHGCVRLNDNDLEAIFNTLNIGSKVYIF